jgi:protein associated with RNAse G/E
MDPGSEVTVISRSYDRTVRRTWKARLLRYSPPLIELVGEFDREVEHPDLGLIARGTVSHEYFWLDRWYNVFRFYEPGGTARNYYCNIAVPAIFESSVLEYVDLEIDVVVWPDGRVLVLDREDFEEAAGKFKFEPEFKSDVYSTLERLLTSINLREFPFQEENRS